MHIDFGFVFGIAPGNAFSMETCAFKLTAEMVDVMGGTKSPHYATYQNACLEAFLIARKHAATTCKMVEIMAHKSCYPCFEKNSRALDQFIARHHLASQDLQIVAARNTNESNQARVAYKTLTVPEAKKDQQRAEKVVAHLVYVLMLYV